MSGAERYELGDLSGLANGQMTSCPAGDMDVLVCRVQGELFAIEDMCSHADTTLSDGLLHGYTVTCALHGAQFDVRTGDHKGPPAYCGVKAFDVAEAEGGVVVTVRTVDKGPDAGPPGGYFQTR